MAAPVPYPDFAAQLALQVRPNSADTPQWLDISELVTGFSQVGRGHPYQVSTGLTSAGRVTIRDPQELFNVANQLDSPFTRGSAGRNVLPYNQILMQAMNPRGGTGNILNANAWRVPYDPSFESYAAGVTPAWLGWYGANQPQVTTSTPLQGTKSLTMAITAGGGFQASVFAFPCIPGRHYRVQVLVNQSVANTVSISLSGHGNMATTTAITTTQLVGVFWADQPGLTMEIGCRAPGSTGTLLIDAIMIEPVTPISPTRNFNGQNGGAGSLNGWRLQGVSAPGNAYISAQQASFNLRAAGIHPDGVGNPQLQSPEFVVSPSTQYWLNGQILNNGISRNITVWWYDATHAFISSSFQTFTGGSDWTQMDATAYTSPANAAFARVGTEAAAGQAADWYINHAYLCAGAPSAFTTSGPVIYPVLRQYTERWPRRWDSNGFEGFADLQLVDAFAAFNAIKPHTEYVQAVVQTSPLYYWRLGESGGSTFVDSSGNAGPPMKRQDAQAGPAIFTPGASMGIPGNPGATGVAISTSDTIHSNWPSSAVVAGNPGSSAPLAVGGGSPANYTIAFWYRHTGPNNPDGTEVCMLGGGTLAIGNGIFINAALGNLPDQVNVVITWPNGIAAIHAPDLWGDGQAHLYVITTTISAGGVCTVNLYVDGTNRGTATGNGTMPAAGLTAATYCYLGGLSDPNNTTGGAVQDNSAWSDCALWGRILTGAEITDLGNAGKGYFGELPSTRITRRLARSGYPTGNNNIPSPRLSTGRTTLAPSSRQDQQPVLGELQAITTAELGTLWIAPDGALVLESRDDRFKRTTAVTTFGEDIAGGECPYLPGVLYDFDPLYLYANVQVTQTQGIIATGGRVTDINAAQAQFFGRTFTTPSLDMNDVNQVQDYADWVFYSHNTPIQRIDSFTIDPMSNPALWPFVFNVEIGQRVKVRRRPRGLAGNLVYAQDYFVEEIVHDQFNFDAGWGPVSGKTKVSLTPIPPNTQPWILDDVNLSVLGNTTRLGF